MIELRDVKAKRTTYGEGGAVYVWLLYEVPDGRADGIGTRPWKIRIPASAATSYVIRERAIRIGEQRFQEIAGRRMSKQEREQVVQDFLLNAPDAIRKMEREGRR